MWTKKARLPSVYHPCPQAWQTVLVAAHGNSIRGMLKHLDDISDEEIVDIEIPTGVPLIQARCRPQAN